MYYHLTMTSKNEKTGPIPVSTTGAESCPDACPLKSAGCYAASGRLSMWWGKVTSGQYGGDFEGFLDQVRSIRPGQLWRHNQAGDLPGIGNRIDGKALRRLTDKNHGRRGFTYTHKPMGPASNRQAVKEANAGGFVVNLSANNLDEADSLAALGVGPVVVVVPESYPDIGRTPGGRRVVVCHEQTGKRESCATCGLCAVGSRSTIVGFRVHGAGARAASRVLGHPAP